tara:strand:- start:52 stop:816 length:765 start_codon:yes stop_codon:yes gene_type:complete
MRAKKQKKPRNKGFLDIFGTHSVLAALSNINRKHQKLIVSESQRSLISPKIRKNIQKIEILSNKEIAKLYGNERTHQGIILTTSLLNQPDLEEILRKSNDKEIVVMLDQVTDPNNIGSIMRSCSLFGCNSIIVSKNNSPDITTSIAKIASGALENVNYIKVTNLSATIKKFKKNNFWVCGLDSNKKEDSNELKIPKKCLIVLGGEGKGLRSLTKKDCDELISIPTIPNKIFNIDSLNVSNACSIALYTHFINHN